jgi:hypothetical protein
VLDRLLEEDDIVPHGVSGTSAGQQMRAIEFVGRLIDENRLDEKKYKRINMHMISAPALEYHLNASSKLNTEMAFLEFLRDRGRAAADAWIRQHKKAVGAASSIDIRETFLGRGHRHAEPSRVEETFRRTGKRAAS